MTYVLDEYDIRQLTPRKRLDKCKEIMKEDDESIRWDAVWLAGEIQEICPRTDKIQKEIADFMEWILKNDVNSIVRHEAAFQIGLRNFRDKIPALVECAINDKSDIASHEAIEALGLMRAWEVIPLVKDMCSSTNEARRDTAIFVVKRLERLRSKGEYRGEAKI